MEGSKFPFEGSGFVSSPITTTTTTYSP
uniref:Uncharacterized protein n=1 Tax=Anguilla anguilla TaxID=7936 RepID=A0A0E9UAN8_ANGAN